MQMTMGIENLPEGSPGLQQVVALAGQYHQDSALRARADAEPRAVLADYGLSMPPQTDVRIVANTAETYNFIMPPDPNAVLADEDLAQVSGGATTASSFISCLMSFSSD